jgi:hypothetical protein
VSATMTIAWPCPSSVEQYAAARRGCRVLTARRFRTDAHMLAAGLYAPSVEPERRHRRCVPAASWPTRPPGGTRRDRRPVHTWLYP